ncbi:hypothetical protein GUJ93_ZPchr0006g43760 [Zizania palustris]|uniref:E3 ubiquitin-protein ligase RMA n=1 Tax=Zizania palustris TaxID=103762 RepID=A0A8J5T007_ZIZPA|nr:hypothetical protein GUJ93_ZPchr0006g43760 [Zizania palustris]
MGICALQGSGEADVRREVRQLSSPRSSRAGLRTIEKEESFCDQSRRCTREMDQLCTSGVSEKASVVGEEPAKRVSSDVPAAAGGGCFDCNICLDFATEPVVTLCGHLYCWPCIYEWLRPDDGADASHGATSSARRSCPVCKAAVSPDTLVPLYGRGGGSSKMPPRGSTIPRRPIVHRREATDRESYQSSDDGGGHRHGNTGPSPLDRSAWRAAAATPRFDVLYPPPPVGGGVSMFHSTSVGVLGGMALAVLPWVSRGQAPAARAYYSRSMNRRLRRQHMEVERSLHQIWFFLVVFAVLCLLLF